MPVALSKPALLVLSALLIVAVALILTYAIHIELWLSWLHLTAVTYGGNVQLVFSSLGGMTFGG